MGRGVGEEQWLRADYKRQTGAYNSAHCYPLSVLRAIKSGAGCSKPLLPDDAPFSTIDHKYERDILSSQPVDISCTEDYQGRSDDDTWFWL